MAGAANKSGAKTPEIKLDLRALLDAKGIKNVLFIDDAFDDLADVEPTNDEREEIWGRAQETDTLLEAAHQEGLNSVDDITAARIKEMTEKEGVLRDVFELSSFVQTYRSKTQVLTPAIEGLRSLGRNVLTAGEKDWRSKLDDVHIVFLDWYFGTDGRQDAIDRASATARELHHLAHKPLIVLISSDDAVQRESAGFKEASQLISGLFDALPKHWLADSFGLHLHMTAFAEVYQKGHVVQGFVDQIHAKAAGAISTFQEVIRSLTLSDYANLQDFSLRTDGHPLGDYLMELLAGLWSDTLFRGELKANLAELNREDFSSLPSFNTPSPALARIYNSAVFDMHVGDFDYHPHYGEEAAEKRLQISLGDIIVEEVGGVPSLAYIIMNPECDLASSPRGKRRIADDQSILMLPGKLVAVNHDERTLRKNLPDTPYFILGNGEPYRIHWHITGMQAVPFANFAQWLAGRTRRARMRALHVLSLQQAVHAHLTRVGLPSPPPIFKPLTATVRTVSGTKLSDGSRTIAQGEFVLPRVSGDDKIAFTREFLVDLKTTVSGGLAGILETVKDEDKAKAMKAEVESSMLDPEAWASLLVPFKLGTTCKKFLGDALWVYRVEHAPDEKQFSHKTLVCVALSQSEPD